MKKLTRVLALLYLCLAIAGCGSTGKDQAGENADGQDAATQGVGTDGAYPGVETQGMGDEGRGYPGGAFDDPRNPLSKSTIYFLYDSSDVKPEYEAVISAHAQYLAEHPGASIVLEGHADERGSREYNIALSEQRANAVARKMGLQGASNSQIKRVSYGEEKPVAFGHDETAWQLNRRVQIVYSRY